MAIEIKSAMLITSGISVLKPIPRRFCGFVKSIRSVHHLSTDSRDNSSFHNEALAIFAQLGCLGEQRLIRPDSIDTLKPISACSACRGKSWARRY